MNNIKKNFLKVIITVLVFIGLVSLSKTTYTSEIATIKEIKSTEIVIENRNGEIKSIKTPKIIMNLIDTEVEYSFDYIQKRWGKPKLEMIEPLE